MLVAYAAEDDTFVVNVIKLFKLEYGNGPSLFHLDHHRVGKDLSQLDVVNPGVRLNALGNIGEPHREEIRHPLNLHEREEGLPGNLLASHDVDPPQLEGMGIQQGDVDPMAPDEEDKQNERQRGQSKDLS